MQICEVFRARIVDVGAETMTVEITGDQDKIDGFVALLKPLGIAEMVNSGMVAMTRSTEPFETTPRDSARQAKHSKNRGSAANNTAA